MKRIWGYVVSLLAAGTLVGSALPACATNDQTIFIHGVLAPSANRQGGSCTYNSDPQQAFLFQPLVDIGLTDSYSAVLLVGNQLIPRGDPQANRAESNRVHINGGIVRVDNPDGTPIREFTSLSTGFNDPQNNNTPGYGPIGLVVLDAPTKDALLPSVQARGTSRTVLVTVKVFGTSLGGVDVESGEFQFPMQVCRGCLVLQDGYDSTSKTQPRNCDKPAELSSATSTTGPCYIGQDLAISCRNCRGLRSPDICDPNVP
ncbi:MAG TPA: hypothetical protein VLT33_39665 [Labilithrix sp.]|nr:hypothetical protein [Labilithrix sp.]